MHAATRGQGAPVDLLIGHNAEEGNLYLVPSGAMDATTDHELTAAAAYACLDPDTLVHAYRQIHPDAPPDRLRSLVLADARVRRRNPRVRRRSRATGDRTFAYEFTWRPADLAARMPQAWVQYVQTGSPGWPR